MGQLKQAIETYLALEKKIKEAPEKEQELARNKQNSIESAFGSYSPEQAENVFQAHKILQDYSATVKGYHLEKEQALTIIREHLQLLNGSSVNYSKDEQEGRMQRRIHIFKLNDRNEVSHETKTI